MKRHILTVILIITALAAAGFLPGPDAVAQASGVNATAFEQPADTGLEESAAVSASPVVQIVVGFTGILFGILTFLPLLKDDHRYGGGRQEGIDE
jgi:hypothetical protein